MQKYKDTKYKNVTQKTCGGSLLSRPLLMERIGLVGTRVVVHVEIQLGDILTLVLATVTVAVIAPSSQT